MKRIVKGQWTWGLCCMLLFSGCAMKQLRDDLQELKTYKKVSGHVMRPQGHDHPVVVVLWALDETDAVRSNYQIAHGDGGFDFYVQGGRYYLMAYEDLNEDGRYQAERDFFGSYKGGQIIDCDQPDSFEQVAIQLQPPGNVPVPADVALMDQKASAQKFEWRKECVGQITTLENPLFTPENASKGFWSPLSFFQEYGMKIYFLEAYDPDKIPVLFVHGANGHPGIFKPMIEQMDHAHYQPWVLFYPSGARLDTISDLLTSMIHEAHLSYSFDDIIVVAHSMGGLVSRSTLLKLKGSDPRGLVSTYITFATPWNGHASVSFGVNHAPAVIPSWYDMIPDNAFIRNLFEQELPAETKHYLFFSFEGKGGSPFHSENTDGTVSLKSQLYPPAQEQAERLFGIPADHVGILSHPETLKLFNQILETH